MPRQARLDSPGTLHPTGIPLGFIPADEPDSLYAVVGL
jgi:hypothetical protein